MRIAVLWTCLAGYINACLKELATRPGVELFVSNVPPDREAPFDDDQYAWIPNHLVLKSPSDFDSLGERLLAFDPEILVFCGWSVPEYRRLAKLLAKRCWRVMTMDNCWSATPKQRLGSMIAQWYVRPLADAIWVPGERQAVFARRLGFEERAIIRGLYSCDQPNLESVYCSRIAHHQPVQHSFLYLGRFVPEKGLDKLVEAYQSYRTKSNAPWPLVCYGAGPLRSYLEGNAGIRVEGFVQPDQLGAALSKAGCLVLPSTFEPWGVVVHEAASAGLLILASQNVGAAVHLVQDYYNGFLCDGKDTDHLSTLMAYVSSLDGEKLEAMSRASHSLSKQYSPRRWADALLQGFRAAARN